MDYTHRFTYGLLAAFFILMSVPALALAPPVAPVGLRHIVKNGSVLDGRITYQIGLGSAATYVEKGISFGKGTMGSLAKGILTRGAGIGLAYTALELLIENAGYLWDSGSSEVMTQGDSGGYQCTSGAAWGNDQWSGIPKTCYEYDAYLLWKQALPGHWLNSFNWVVTSVSLTSGNVTDNNHTTRGYNEVCYLKNGGSGPADCDQNVQFIPTYYPGQTVTQPQIPGEPLTEDQIGEQVIQNGSPGTWEQMLTDPVTGMPITTPEVADGMWDLQKDKVEEAGGDPQTVPQPTTTGSTTAGTSEEAPETDIPDFCTWAETMCDLADWFMETPEEPEPPEVPYQNVPLPSSWDSGLGASSCPPATTVAIWGGTTIEIPWQPACDGADILRPILLAMAYFIAAGILIGRKA